MSAWRSPLVPLWAGFGLLTALAWWRWGQTGLPVGSFWWDDLALAGASEAIRQGLVPTVDFWAPFFASLYLKFAAEQVVGPGRAFLLECVVQGVFVLLMFSWLVAGQRQRWEVYATGFLAVLMASLPFNIGSIAEAQLGSAAFSCGYNRLGGAVITLVALLPAIQLPSKPQRLAWWLAVLLAFTWLLKITVLQICFALLVFMVAFRMKGLAARQLAQGAGVAFFATLVLGFWVGGWHDYVEVLSALSKVRWQVMQERLALFQHKTLFEHRLELFAMVLSAGLVAIRGWSLKRPWVVGVLFQLFGLTAVVAFTAFNFGDYALMPAMGFSCTLLVVSSSKSSSERVATGGLERIAALMQMALVGMFWMLMLVYVFVLGRWGLALAGSAPAQPVPVHDLFLSKQYEVPAAQWASRPNVAVAGVPTWLKSPASQAAYIEQLAEVLPLLKSQFPDPTTSVYALDFPAFAFSVLAGYRVPRHAHAWLLVGHEITIDAHPPGAQLFSDVDVLMVSKCSLIDSNRGMLAAIYRLEIERNWRKKVGTKCWDVYGRI